MHLAPLIKDLSIILAVAAVVSVLFKRLKLPVVLGYLLAGFVVGPNSASFPRLNDMPNVQVWAEIGVIVLMFSLGLEFSFRRLLRLGIPVALTGLIQVIGMVYLGFAVGNLVGWSHTSCLFLGAILSISSTTIIAKTFEELGIKGKRYAEFVFGILILEDLIAIIFMVVFSTPRPDEGLSAALLFSTFGKMFVVVGAWFAFGYYFLPRALRHVGKIGNDEMLVIFTLALCFLLAFVATEFQFSSSLGAFIMGSILSESSESHRVEKLIRPIRDLFLAVFFVTVGMLIEPQSLLLTWPVVLLLTGIVIFGKIFFVILGSLISGQRVRDGVRAGFSLTQIGEFSFILATLGIQKGSIDSEILSITVSISMLTTLLTPAMVTLGQRFADFLDKKLPSHIQEFLNDYQQWWHKQTTAKTNRRIYFRASLIWILNGFVIVTLFALAAQTLLPYFMEVSLLAHWAPLLSWAIAFTLSLPFIWGMFWAFSRGQNQANREVVFIVLKYTSRLGLLFLVGTLSGAFFEAKLAVAIIVLTTLASLIILYRRLESAYGEFERKFVRTFKQKDARPFSGFFPWDAHLAKVPIPNDSPFAGMTLSEADVRRQTGSSIVNVRRGKKDIVAPLGSFRLFPDDELLVLGTDDQIQKLISLSQPQTLVQDLFATDFRIRSFEVQGTHPFCGKKISDLNLHDVYASILVGIERGTERIMTPPSDFAVQAGDFLWLVGPTDRLDLIS